MNIKEISLADERLDALIVSSLFVEPLTHSLTVFLYKVCCRGLLRWSWVDSNTK